MESYIKIKPIQIGELQNKTANAISWSVQNLTRGIDFAIANCYLLYYDSEGNSSFVTSFQVDLNNTTLQSWGADDSVIDDVILAYSPLFQKDNS